MTEPRNPRYSILPARAVFDAALSRCDLRVLAALGTYTNDDGWCFPQQATLAKRLGVARPRVSASIKRLTAAAYVETQVRALPGAGMRGLWYRVILDTTSTSPDTTSSPGVREIVHPEPAEQNGETDPVFAKPYTGAGVRKRSDPVFAKSYTGYIDELAQGNETPVSPRKRGRRDKTASLGKGERSPPGFDEAWAAWPKPGSSRERALKAWRAHRAPGAAKLAAVKAYLATKQAQAENFRFVPYMQRWLQSSLTSFVEVAERQTEARAEIATKQAQARPLIFCRECRTSYAAGVDRCRCPPAKAR